MKLYATVTSERASKSQGGQEYIIIDLNVGRNQVHQIELIYKADTQDGYATDEWVLQHREGSSEDDNEWDIIAQGNVIPESRGNKQKGDLDTAFRRVNADER